MSTRDSINFRKAETESNASNPELSIVIPVKNEENNIIELIESLITEFSALNYSSSIFKDQNLMKLDHAKPTPFYFEIIIIDDNSTDSTFQNIYNYIKKPKENLFKLKSGLESIPGFINESNIDAILTKHFKIRLLKRFDGKHSVGKAIKWGIENALGRYIITMDGDLSHIPSEAVQIYEELKKGHDFVVGGRFFKDLAPFPPKKRYKISKMFNTIARFLYGSDLLDYTTGFRGFTKDLYNELNVKSNGFEIHVELNIKLKKKSKNFTEIPIHYVKRKSGSSKLHYKRVMFRYGYRLLISRFW